MQKEQYVCTVCGFNMVGYYPNRCPFCGASREYFITAAECSAKFQVRSTSVTEQVTRLNSVPRLGYEHAAYAIATNHGTLFWIDCPSCFDKRLQPPSAILFTHHHFLGASNLYREHFGAHAKIHKRDSTNRIARTFTFDELFEENFTAEGIEAFHIGGHTPGLHILLQGCPIHLRLRLPQGRNAEVQSLRPRKRNQRRWT